MSKLIKILGITVTLTSLLTAIDVNAAKGTGGGGGGVGGVVITGTQQAALEATLLVDNPPAEIFSVQGFQGLLGAHNLGWGKVMAVSGDTVFAKASDNATLTSKKLYVYQRNAGVWTTQAVLTPENPNEEFNSVALEADTLVASIKNPLPQGTVTNPSPPNPSSVQGVYVYQRVAGVWTKQARLVGSDALLESYQFGYDVAISGANIMVTAPGGVRLSGPFIATSQEILEQRRGIIYLFQNVAGVWQQTAKLTGGLPGVADSFGGFGVALNGDTLAVGRAVTTAIPTSINPFGTYWANEVVVYQKVGTAWGEQAVLKPSDQSTLAQALDPRNTVVHYFNLPAFGAPIALNGNTLIVGGTDLLLNGGKIAGTISKAYVLTRSGTAWSEQAQLKPKSGGGAFGNFNALSGNTAVFGYGNGGCKSSRVDSASAFVRRGTTWAEAAIPAPAVVCANTQDTFGTSVAVDGTTLVVSHPLFDQRVYKLIVTP
jgi:hypothetical protein